jgi:acyl phosphate:glycerol-3-phosphate acyltransferase
MKITLAAITCYLIGSIPFGYIIGRFIKGIDIRRYGSGNIGATNASRILGNKWGAVVLVLDALKGFVGVSLVAWYFINETISGDNFLFIYLLGLAAIIGHNWTIFLGFKGGKGVSTTLGVLLGIGLYSPEFRIATFILIGLWIAIVALSRIVSLASLGAALSLPVLLFIFNILNRLPASSVYFGLIVCILIIIKHQDNIRDLREKRKRRLRV